MTLKIDYKGNNVQRTIGRELIFLRGRYLPCTILQEIVDLVNEESAKKGLKMDVKKTKTTAACRSKETPQVNISVNGINLEQVKQFMYLGQPITDDGKTDTEIRRRIEIAYKNFMNMKDTLTSRRLRIETKKG